MVNVEAPISVLECANKIAPTWIEDQCLASQHRVEENSVVRQHCGVLIDLIFETAVGEGEMDIVRAGIEREDRRAERHSVSAADDVDARDKFRNERVIRSGDFWSNPGELPTEVTAGRAVKKSASRKKCH